MSDLKFFIGTYTNQVKDYADKPFLENLFKLSMGCPVLVIDNTKGTEYTDRLKGLTSNYDNFTIEHITVPGFPKRTQFLRNVAESANRVREEFLKSDCDYLLLVESDVIPPADLLIKFDWNIKQLETNGIQEAKPWGILGALYYAGFHDYSLQGIHPADHVLSGCSVYRRELIEKYPFRWSTDNLDAFSDAWICFDAKRDYSFWNNHSIRCDHLELASGVRQSKAL